MAGSASGVAAGAGAAAVLVVVLVGTHPAELRLPQDAVTVAGRMFDGADPAARAWALTNLPVDALRELRAMRGYDAGPDAVSLDIAIAHRADA